MSLIKMWIVEYDSHQKSFHVSDRVLGLCLRGE